MIRVRDRPDVPHAGRPQGDQQRQRGFRPVGRRAERVEAEHRDAGEHADALLPLLVRRQLPAEEPIGESHALLSPSPR